MACIVRSLSCMCVACVLCRQCAWQRRHPAMLYDYMDLCLYKSKIFIKRPHNPVTCPYCNCSLNDSIMRVDAWSCWSVWSSAYLLCVCFLCYCCIVSCCFYLLRGTVSCVVVYADLFDPVASRVDNVTELLAAPWACRCGHLLSQWVHNSVFCPFVNCKCVRIHHFAHAYVACHTFSVFRLLSGLLFLLCSVLFAFRYVCQ